MSVCIKGASLPVGICKRYIDTLIVYSTNTYLRIIFKLLDFPMDYWSPLMHWKDVLMPCACGWCLGMTIIAIQAYTL